MAVERSFFQITSLILIYSFCGIQSGLDYATAISTYPRISLISPINKEDLLSENITNYYLVGSILAGIFFLFTKNWMRKIFIISDIIIITGYLVTIFSKPTKNSLYVGRFFVGYGTTTLNLVGPLMVVRNWPNGNLLLASFGLSYQLGQTISDSIVIDEWRYELLGPCVVALVQLILVSFTNKVVFECEEVLGETDSENIRGKIRFAKSVPKACIIQLMTTMIGLQWVSNFGPKHVHDLPSHSTPVTIIGSIISIILVKLFEIKKLLLASFSILTVELFILAILIPNSGGRMTLILFSVYLFSFTSGLSSPPLVYTVKLFLPKSRGEGIGLVSTISESTYLIVKLAIKRLGIKISEKEILWILAVISLLALYPLSRFLRDRGDEDKDKDEDGGPDPEADTALELVRISEKESLWILTVISLLALYPLSRLLRDRGDEDKDKDEDGGPDPEADTALELVRISEKESLWILTVISLLALYPLSRVREEDEDKDGGPDPEADIAHEVAEMISPK